MRLINATIYVEMFTNVDVGKYQIDNALWNNQADTGNGSNDIRLGDVLYVPASDPNTFMLLPGVVHRYKFVEILAQDGATVSAVLQWDEPGAESDVPSNGVTCLFSQVTDVQKLGVPPSDLIYGDVLGGSTTAAINLNTAILDSLASGGGGGGSTTMEFQFPTPALSWVVRHNKGTQSFTESLWDSGGRRLYAGVTVVDNNAFVVNFTSPESGRVSVTF